MKQLFLIRHGEAGFSNGIDFERNLTQKGRDQLSRLGTLLKKKFHSIDKMYCSSANRTVETAEILEDFFLIDDKEFRKEIYEGNLQNLLNILEDCPNHCHSCLIVGHNPILSLLASHVSGENYTNLQPGMLACIDLAIDDWKMIGFNSGDLLEIVQ